MAPKIHVVLNASYVDLPKFAPERNTRIIINILSYFCSHTTNAALRSNNPLLYIPNCPRPSSHLLYFQALYINFGLYLQECWQSTVLVHLDSQFPVLTAVIITDVISSEHSSASCPSLLFKCYNGFLSPLLTDRMTAWLSDRINN